MGESLIHLFRIRSINQHPPHPLSTEIIAEVFCSLLKTRNAGALFQID